MENPNGKRNLSNSVQPCVLLVAPQAEEEAVAAAVKADTEHLHMNLPSSMMIEWHALIAEESLLNLQLKDISHIVRPQ